MLSKDRLLHPATIIATIALLVALSGAGYAATKIGTAQLKNNAVTTAKIKNNAVTTAKIPNNAVSSAKLRAGAVQAADLAAGAVGAAKIANGAVTSAKIGAGAVEGPALGNGSVTTAKLGPNAVTAAKIAGGTITAANIQNGQVVKGNGELVSGRLALAPGAGNTLLLTLPNIATVQVDCPLLGAWTTTVTNASASTLTANVVSLTQGGTPVIQRTAAAPGASATLPNDAIAQSTTWQLSYTGANGVVHVATVTQAASVAAPPAFGCVWSAQALTTG